MSVKVFTILGGLTEHKVHLILIIIKQYPLMQNSFYDREVVLGRINKRTGETLRALDDVSYANSHTLWKVNFFSGLSDLVRLNC